MTDLVEQSQFDNVYQLETNDQVLAGPGGIANRQAQQLANRTKYLLDYINSKLGAATEGAAGIAAIASQAEALAGIDDTKIMTALKVKTIVDALVNAAPGTLDTLNELAAALGDDPNFATTVMNALALKEDKTALMAGAYLNNVLSVDNLFHIREEYASNVKPSGAPSGGSFNRVLNTVVVNNISGASLSSNQITLPVGTYFIIGHAGAAQAHKPSLYNETDGVYTGIIGTAEYVNSTQSYAVTKSEFSGLLTLAAPKVLSLKHWVYQAASFGEPANDGNDEIYSNIYIWRLS